MAFCSKCGAVIEDNAKFCEACGAPVEPGTAQSDGAQQTVFDKFTDTEDTTSTYSPDDIEKNKVMAILSYLGILVLIPIFAVKDSPYTKFHANQGLVLLIVEIGYSVITRIINSIIGVSLVWTLLSLVNLLFLALAILGIVNAVNGKAKKLPIFGEISLIK